LDAKEQTMNASTSCLRPIVVSQRASLRDAAQLVSTPMIVIDLVDIDFPVALQDIDAAPTQTRPVVLISAIGVGTSTDGLVQRVAVSEAVARCQWPHALTLRTAPIAEDLTVYLPMIEAGSSIFHCIGPAPCAWVSAIDVMQVAAVGALQVGARAGTTYDVTGPTLTSANDLLEALGALAATIGEVDPEHLRDALTKLGLDIKMVDYVVAHQQWCSSGFAVSSTIERALGRRAIDPVELFSQARRGGKTP
jgi:uncharacterized protein YbjT (DUF2867 family)